MAVFYCANLPSTPFLQFWKSVQLTGGTRETDFVAVKLEFDNFRVHISLHLTTEPNLCKTFCVEFIATRDRALFVTFLVLSCRDGSHVAILQDQAIEIRWGKGIFVWVTGLLCRPDDKWYVFENLVGRHSRDDYSSVIGRCTMDRDPYPQWRRIVWSPNIDLLAYSDSLGNVTVFDLVGSVVCTIPSVGSSCSFDIATFESIGETFLLLWSKCQLQLCFADCDTKTQHTCWSQSSDRWSDVPGGHWKWRVVRHPLFTQPDFSSCCDKPENFVFSHKEEITRHLSFLFSNVELIVINHLGSLRCYKITWVFHPVSGQVSCRTLFVCQKRRVNRVDFFCRKDLHYRLSHSFEFSIHYPRGIGAVVYHPDHSILLLGGDCKPDPYGDQFPVATRHGITAWRLLSDMPFYKLVTDYETDLREVTNSLQLICSKPRKIKSLVHVLLLFVGGNKSLLLIGSVSPRVFVHICSLTHRPRKVSWWKGWKTSEWFHTTGRIENKWVTECRFFWQKNRSRSTRVRCRCLHIKNKYPMAGWRVQDVPVAWRFHAGCRAPLWYVFVVGCAVPAIETPVEAGRSAWIWWNQPWRGRKSKKKKTNERSVIFVENQEIDLFAWSFDNFCFRGNIPYWSELLLCTLFPEFLTAFNLVDAQWWSEHAVILARGTGALCLSSVRTLRNLLGNSPEWFEPGPVITSARNESFLGLEVSCACFMLFTTPRTKNQSTCFDNISDDSISVMRLIRFCTTVTSTCCIWVVSSVRGSLQQLEAPLERGVRQWVRGQRGRGRRNNCLQGDESRQARVVLCDWQRTFSSASEKAKVRIHFAFRLFHFVKSQILFRNFLVCDCDGIVICSFPGWWPGTIIWYVWNLRLLKNCMLARLV